MAAKKVYAVMAIVIVAVAVVGFYFFVLPPPYHVAEGEGTIGRSGGCVYDGDANVTIPAGVLEADTKIAVKALNETMLPAVPPPFTGLLGAASFGPDGLAFRTNVTIIIPLDESKSPGTHLSLFVYDPQTEEFVDTGVFAQVNPDGRTASAKVDHFSTYAVFDGLTRAALDTILSYSLAAGLTWQEAFDNIVNFVTTELGINVGDKVGDMKVVGILIDMDYSVDGQEGTLIKQFGNVDGSVEVTICSYSGSTQILQDGVQKQVTFSLNIGIYMGYEYVIHIDQTYTTYATVGEYQLAFTPHLILDASTTGKDYYGTWTGTLSMRITIDSREADYLGEFSFNLPEEGGPFTVTGLIDGVVPASYFFDGHFYGNTIEIIWHDPVVPEYVTFTFQGTIEQVQDC